MGGLTDMITGDSNRQALGAAKSSLKGQKAISDRIVRLYDTILAKVQAADAGGQFSPTQQMQLADANLNNREGVDRANTATIQALSHRPGDSEPSLQDQGLSLNYQLQKRQQDFGIRQGAFQGMLNAYNSVPASQTLGAAQMYGQNANQQLGMMQDPSAFWRTALTAWQLSKGGM